MKVGDLIQATDGDHGVVLSVKYIKGGEHWVICLWQDGTVEGICNKDLEVLNEAR